MFRSFLIVLAILLIVTFILDFFQIIKLSLSQTKGLILFVALFFALTLLYKKRRL